jgi:hypothetical protein
LRPSPTIPQQFGHSTDRISITIIINYQLSIKKEVLPQQNPNIFILAEELIPIGDRD